MEKALHHLHLFDFGEPFFHAFQTRNGETKVNEYRVKHLCEFLKRIFRVECEFVNVLCVRVSFLSNGKKRNLIFYITKIWITERAKSELAFVVGGGGGSDGGGEMVLLYDLFLHLSKCVTEATNRLSIRSTNFYSIYSNHVRIENIKDDLNAFLNRVYWGRKAIDTKLNSILIVGNFTLYCAFAVYICI